MRSLCAARLISSYNTETLTPLINTRVCVPMTFLPEFVNSLTMTFSYMFIYNLALFLIFFTLFQIISFSWRTLYSFGNLGYSFLTKTVTISLFSMAGVPPFLGFFAKVFIFVMLSDANFFVLFPFFFILLFTGLYFYVQNIRILNATNSPNLVWQHTLNMRVVPVYYSTSITILYILIFGFFYVDDLFLFFSWLLN